MTGIESPREPIDTTNDYLLSSGENLPNHSMSRRGRGKFIHQALSDIPVWRTRQDAFRYAGWLVTMAEILPDSEGEEGLTFEQIRNAIRNA